MDYQQLSEHLDALFLVAAEEVRNAKDWRDTQATMQATTYPITVALGRIDQGWSVEEIRSELDLRLGLGSLTRKGLATLTLGH